MIFLIGIGFLFLNQYAIAQEKKPITFIQKEHRNFTTDRLGNIYLINPYRITMYDKNGDSLREFNSRKFGEITYVDATDPYQLLVFFKDYNLILFLDNFLSENGDIIDLQTLGFDQVTFACQSRERGLWIFDLVRQRIIKLNEDYQQTHESINLAQWFGQSSEIKMMLEYNNQLYAQNTEGKILIFDHFATFIKNVGIQTESELQILENQILYLRDDRYCQYYLDLFEENCKIIDEQSTIHLRKEKGRLYYSDEVKLSIFKTD